MLLLVEDFWEVNWPVHLATEVPVFFDCVLRMSKDHIVLNTVLFAKFSFHQVKDNPFWQHLLLLIQCPNVTTCSVYSVIEIFNIQLLLILHPD